MKKILSFILVCVVCLQLCACVAQGPSNEVQTQGKQQCIHQWRDAYCENPAKCTMCGQTTGSALGHRYIKGVCIRCNDTDSSYVAYGTISGTITYKYNDFVGNRGDSGALILLISKDVKSLPDRLGLAMTSEKVDGLYDTKADGNGNYVFNHIPAGEYYIVVLSKNTNEDPSKVAGYRSWGPAYGLFSEEGQNNALLTAKTRKIRNDNIVVYGDETTNFSYDFGITYF